MSYSFFRIDTKGDAIDSSRRRILKAGDTAKKDSFSVFRIDISDEMIGSRRRRVPEAGDTAKKEGDAIGSSRRRVTEAGDTAKKEMKFASFVFINFNLYQVLILKGLDLSLWLRE